MTKRRWGTAVAAVISAVLVVVSWIREIRESPALDLADGQAGASTGEVVGVDACPWVGGVVSAGG